MTNEPNVSTSASGMRDRVPAVLFLIGLGAGIAALVLPSSSHAASGYVRDGLAGIAAAIVSAGAFVAYAILRSRTS